MDLKFYRPKVYLSVQPACLARQNAYAGVNKAPAASGRPQIWIFFSRGHLYIPYRPEPKGGSLFIDY